MSIISSVDQLPEKIQSALQRRKKLGGNFIISFKTLFKPNATVPILWFTLLSDGIIFLNTHKTRGVYKELTIAEINSIRIRRLSYGENMVEIISNNVFEKDFSIPIPKEIDLNILKQSLERTNLPIVSEVD